MADLPVSQLFHIIYALTIYNNATLNTENTEAGDQSPHRTEKDHVPCLPFLKMVTLT